MKKWSNWRNEPIEEMNTLKKCFIEEMNPLKKWTNWRNEPIEEMKPLKKCVEPIEDWTHWRSGPIEEMNQLNKWTHWSDEPIEINQSKKCIIDELSRWRKVMWKTYYMCWRQWLCNDSLDLAVILLHGDNMTPLKQNLIQVMTNMTRLIQALIWLITTWFAW